MPSVPLLLRELLRGLREERGLSRSDLSFATVRLGFAGVPEPTIEALEIKPGRVPDADTLEAIAAALEVQPDAFYEYPIAVARRTATQATRDAAAGPPAPSGELGRRLSEPQPKPESQPRRRRRRAQDDRPGTA